MRVLRPVVEPATRLLPVARANLPQTRHHKTGAYPSQRYRRCPCLFIVFLRNFKAAFLSRVFVTKLSKNLAFVIDGAPEIVPLAVDLHEDLRRDAIASGSISYPSIRLFRISEANMGPNLCHQYRTVSWLISTPRSCSRSSTFRSDNGKRTYSITARRMISGLL